MLFVDHQFAVRCSHKHMLSYSYKGGIGRCLHPLPCIAFSTLSGQRAMNKKWSFLHLKLVKDLILELIIEKHNSMTFSGPGLVRGQTGDWTDQAGGGGLRLQECWGIATSSHLSPRISAPMFDEGNLEVMKLGGEALRCLFFGIQNLSIMMCRPVGQIHSLPWRLNRL